MAIHTSPSRDKDTGYAVPSGLEFEWEGERRDGKGRAGAKLAIDAGQALGKGGLMEKVDVLAEIPYVIRKGLAAVTGTKPYIYQVRLASVVWSRLIRSVFEPCDTRSHARGRDNTSQGVVFQ